MLPAFTILLLFQCLGEGIVFLLKLPIPGPVAGMLLLMSALIAWPKLQDMVEQGANTLLSHLSLLFVPVGVGVVTHLDVLRQHGFGLLVVIALSTWIGLAVSALTLRALMRSRADEAEAPDA